MSALPRCGSSYSWVPPLVEHFPRPIAAQFDLKDVVEAAAKAHATMVRYAVPPCGEPWVSEDGRVYGSLEDSFDVLVQRFAEHLRHVAIRDGFMVEERRGGEA